MVVKGKLKIRNKLGLHARPAALFVQTVGRFKCELTVSKGGVEVNGKSMMGLMMLAAESGSELELTLEGQDAARAFRELQLLCDRNFDE